MNIYFEKWIRYNDNINNGMLNNPFEILSKTKINDAYHELEAEYGKGNSEYYASLIEYGYKQKDHYPLPIF